MDYSNMLRFAMGQNLEAESDAVRGVRREDRSDRALRAHYSNGAITALHEAAAAAHRKPQTPTKNVQAIVSGSHHAFFSPRFSTKLKLEFTIADSLLTIYVQYQFL
ncbi:hypothetical protein EVAR_52444_1 [Eumeta japonica]|uniref:Uncharacterized protein n=1 Tax=Eumeta variegata TaxID=151549 RepID=A0A4C1YQ17_EUMVA|nr:hypothetical protein EVAR_52444_1 [Eumeta japonica]